MEEVLITCVPESRETETKEDHTEREDREVHVVTVVWIGA